MLVPAARLRLGDRAHVEPGREGGRLVHPGRHHAGRRDDEERRRAARARMGDQRQRLQGLAQTHVVAEDAAKTRTPRGTPAIGIRRPGSAAAQP